MEKFNVNLDYTFRVEVTVEANDADEAVDIIQEEYNKGGFRPVTEDWLDTQIYEVHTPHID